MKVLWVLWLLLLLFSNEAQAVGKKKQVSWSSDDVSKDDEAKPKSPSKKKHRQGDDVEELTDQMTRLHVGSSASSSQQWQASDWNAGSWAGSWHSADSWHSGRWWQCHRCGDWHVCNH